MPKEETDFEKGYEDARWKVINQYKKILRSEDRMESWVRTDTHWIGEEFARRGISDIEITLVDREFTDEYRTGINTYLSELAVSVHEARKNLKTMTFKKVL